MAGLLTLTAANSIATLTVPGLYSTPVQLQGYSTDAAFETEAAEALEVMKGVDGAMSAGFVPFMTRQTFNFQADSPSIQIIETWWNTQKTNREVLFGNATIVIPGLQAKYTFTKGALMSFVPVPGARKTLQPRPAILMWDDISPAPYSAT